jgi:hypothetical protein
VVWTCSSVVHKIQAPVCVLQVIFFIPSMYCIKQETEMVQRQPQMQSMKHTHSLISTPPNRLQLQQEGEEQNPTKGQSINKQINYQTTTTDASKMTTEGPPTKAQQQLHPAEDERQHSSATTPPLTALATMRREGSSPPKQLTTPSHSPPWRPEPPRASCM